MKFNSLKRVRVFIALALVVLLSSAASSQTKLAIRAGHIVLADGSVQVGGWLLTDASKIAGVVAASSKAPEGYHEVDRSSSYLVPGFVDLSSRAGAPHDLVEDAESNDEMALAVDSLSPSHRDFEMLPAGGVTAVVLLPVDSNVVGGRGALVHTGKNTDRVLAGATPLALSFKKAAWSSDKQPPTSFAGAHDLLRSAFAAARNPKSRVASPLAMAARGELPVVFRVSTDREIAAALSLASSSGLEVALMGVEGIDESLDLIGGAKVRVALSVPKLSGGRRAAKLPAMIQEKGVGLALFAGSPKSSPEALRIGAVLAVREGLTAKAALAAITSVPASMAGCEGTVGSLKKGCQADFLVFSGPPLDLSSAHSETWIAGKRVFTRTRVVVPTAKEEEAAK